MKHSFSNKNRQHFISQLDGNQFDMVIIGGGITGAGIALDAASRGLKVALIEKNDFASGTSSRSTKLIHGGLRYLKQLDIGLVMETGRERAVVHKIAPHIVRPEKMLLPIKQGGTLGKTSTALALTVYDVLAGVYGKERKQMLNKTQVFENEPLLATDDIIGGGIYYEYRTDDSRLTIEVMKTAHSYGATCLNYVEATDLVYKDDKVVGINCKDSISGREFIINADVTVNAAGPWVDLIRKKDGSITNKRLQLTKGVHIVVDKTKLPLKQSIYFDVDDGRMMFAIPRQDVVYIGTTDTVHNQSIDDPIATNTDIEYILAAANNMFDNAALAKTDVLSSWAGLRPLIHESGKSPSELSRKDEMFIAPSGLVSIAGGKLTGYRKMAERVVNKVSKIIKRKYPDRKFKSCYTKQITLSGGGFDKNVKEYINQLRTKYEQFDNKTIASLVYKYGSDAEKILNNAASTLDSAELAYSIDNEMIITLSDYIIRRTARLFFERHQLNESETESINKTITESLDLNQDHSENSLLDFQKAYLQAVDFK